MNHIKSGFYVTIGKKGFFIVTDYKNKTQTLASKIITKLNRVFGYDIPDNPDTRKELLYWASYGTIEYKHLPENAVVQDWYQVKYGRSCINIPVTDGYFVSFIL